MLNFLDRIKPSHKAFLGQIGRHFGLEIKLNGPRSRTDLRLVHFLRMHNVDLTLDVGANKGQFAQSLFAAGYSGRIVSFEPLPQAHTKLSKRAKLFGDRWIIGPQIALSDRTGIAEFNVTASDTSSSLLKPTKAFTNSLSEVRVVDHIEVKTGRLDDVASSYVVDVKNLFLKLDVQGGEQLVLNGAADMLNRSCGIITELCVDSLYSGQPPVTDMMELLASYGFEIWDISSAYTQPQSLRLGAIDLVCFKPSTTNE